MSYFARLRERAASIDSSVCVGLDPVRAKLPAHLRQRDDAFVRFLGTIVEATADVALCFKPNLGFFLAEGRSGVEALEQLRAMIPQDVPVILDAKFGDIGSTAAAYAAAAFERWSFDAVTLSPYVGDDAVLEFAKYADRGGYVLARTSNPGAPRLQDRNDLWRAVVDAVHEWNQAGNLGIVVGATRPEQLAEARAAAGDLPFLVPGVGSQGGDLVAAVRHGSSPAGDPVVINSSRGIIFADDGPDFGAAARAAAITLRDQVRQAQSGARA